MCALGLDAIVRGLQDSERSRGVDWTLAIATQELDSLALERAVDPGFTRSPALAGRELCTSTAIEGPDDTALRRPIWLTATARHERSCLPWRSLAAKAC